MTIMNAICTLEPGFDSILFSSKEEREKFEDWSRANFLLHRIMRYARHNEKMYRTIEYWERSPFEM